MAPKIVGINQCEDRKMETKNPGISKMASRWYLP